MIKIDDEYVIDMDECNYILKKKVERKKNVERKKEDEKDRYRSIGYYRSLQEALTAYYRENVRASLLNRSCTLPEALSTISDVSDQVAETIRAAVPNLTIIKS